MNQDTVFNAVINDLVKVEYKVIDGETYRVTMSRAYRNVFCLVEDYAKMFHVRMNGNSIDRMTTRIFKHVEKYNL